jgi:hypothetical protein
VRVAQITQSRGFGFLLMERRSMLPDAWTVTAFRVDGSVLTRCQLTPEASLRCEPGGWLR